jgi:hypothetical protein
MTSPEAPAPPGQVAPDDLAATSVLAASRAFAAAADELPQPGAALGWTGP